jgi:threonylcarbamoyladenosine tRNA methylthiotransferase MtaB
MQIKDGMKVYLDSVGCRLNQSEIERMALQLLQSGHTLVGCPEESDLVIINTCTVTAAAASDSRNRTRRAHRRNPQAQIVLTGCWSELEPSTAAELPGVVNIIPNDGKDHLVPNLLSLPQDFFDNGLIARQPIPGNRRRTRAFIKVQEGCDNHCTYCITTIARGPARSVPLHRILRDVQAAVAGGVKEIVLTGVQLSAYGRDLTDSTSLSTVIQAILTETDVPRIRISSLEPWRIADDFFLLWENPRLCRQLHLPLQSGCSSTLQRMGRPIRPAKFAQLVNTARQAIPGLAVTTDMIVGFPGEREEEFAESMRFMQAMCFAGAHIFTYSPRPGTRAADMSGVIPADIAHARSQQLREVAARSAQAYRSQFLGETLEVLWETQRGSSHNGYQFTGLTDNYLRVFTDCDRDISNTLTDVCLLEIKGEEIHAELL